MCPHIETLGFKIHFKNTGQMNTKAVDFDFGYKKKYGN